MVRPLRLWRGDKGWSQADLARESGVGRTTIAQIETGKRPEAYPSTRLKVATALGCRPSDIAEFANGGSRDAQTDA